MTKEEIAQILLNAKSVSINLKNPFTFVSGILSPIYCDNRLLMSHIIERRKIVDAFEELIENNGIEFDLIGGVATSAIPHSAWLAEKLNSEMIYIRPEKKEHGKGKQIEGVLYSGKKVLVIEDLVSTGGSSTNAIQAVKDSGGIVNDCAAIFSYGFKEAVGNFAKVNCKLHTLTDLETLLKVAIDAKSITEEDKKAILEWQKNPKDWGK